MTTTEAGPAGDDAAAVKDATAAQSWRPSAEHAIGALWFMIVFGSITWVWELNPRALPSPDEALNRFAAQVIADTWRPFLQLPFADPEDLAHPRHWVSVGDRALPSYAPVTIYLYALFLKLHRFGFVLITALPASGIGAFAAGIAGLLPGRRKWLALVTPLLAFPALYWAMRPLMNLSLLLACIGWAFFAWSAWLTERRPQQLTAAVLCVGAAAAVRPDYAAYLMLVTLLFGLSQALEQWRRVVVLVLIAGGSAVALNLFLNWLVTGHPTVAAYQIVAARDEGPSQSGGVLGLLRQLLIPMGIPEPRMAASFVSRYWLEMGPIAGLTLSQLLLLRHFLKKPRLPQLLFGLAIFVMVCFVLSRMDRDLNGAQEHFGQVHHSMPRYWSPVYLLATLTPVLFLGRSRRRSVFGIGSALLVALALTSGYEIYRRERYSQTTLRLYGERATRTLRSLQRRIPKGAMVYSGVYDKLLWPYWRVGTVSEPEPSATSIARAAKVGLPLFVFDPSLRGRQLRALERALHRCRLDLENAGEPGLYRVVAEP